MADDGSDQGDEPDPATLSDTPRGRGDHLQLPARFTVKRSLGEGGMGKVVLAFDRMLSRDVAIKILAREHLHDPKTGVRFLREARAAAQLRHPSIVQVFDVDPNGGFIVMELVLGESLAAKLWREKKLDADEVRRIGSAMLRGLATAHEAGIVHRDIKPANVLLGEDGEVKVADFGVAYFGDSELTQPGTRVGTPAYMAPEQLRGKDVDSRADVYSAGVTLFEAATGERPGDGSLEEHAHQLLAATGDKVLSYAIARAIRDKAGFRFADAGAFAIALDATEVPSIPPPARIRAKTVMAAKRFGRTALLVGALLGIAIGVGAFAYKRAHVAKPEHHTVALLPFVDKTHSPLLDFAAAGLPNLLGLELHDVPDVSVLGYYQLLGVAGADASHEAWLAAAQKLGADVIVQGELTGNDNAVHIALQVDRLDGKHLGTLVRDARVQEVPDAVRRTAPWLIKTAFDRTVDGGGGAPTTFAADRELQLGIAALDREHLPDAIDHLRAALHEAPDNPLGHYYLALALTWSVPPAEPALEEIQRALATGKLDEAQRDMLAGVAKIATLDYPACVELMRPAADKFPNDRDVLYVTFECLFHGGRPAEAMAVYHHINAIAPKFRLALIHALTFYVGHANADGMAWALALNEPTGDTYDPSWEHRVLVANREYAAAIDLLSRQSASLPAAQAKAMRSHLVVVYMLAGQIDLAEALLAQVAEGAPAQDYGTAWAALATLRGDEAARRKWLDPVMRYYATMPPGPSRAMQWLQLAGSELPVASLDELTAIDKALGESVVPTYEKSLNLQIAQTLLAEARGDAARLGELAGSSLLEVKELAHAAIARRAGDRAAAIVAMRRSIEADGDGKFLADQWWRLAGDLRATGDHAGTIAACDEVLRPRLTLGWAWVSATADCMTWTAEADEALGKSAEAKAMWAKLVAMRTAAPANDPLVNKARAALAK